jgi:hypothetical protein
MLSERSPLAAYYRELRKMSSAEAAQFHFLITQASIDLLGTSPGVRRLAARARADVAAAIRYAREAKNKNPARNLGSKTQPAGAVQ